MSKYQVAVVDDEPQITEILQTYIEDSFKGQVEVEVFNDPTKALARLKEKKFDAISLDHRMPNLTGMEIVNILRSSSNVNEKTKILLLTAYLEDAECSHSNLLDQVIFLEKPVTEERYVRWIKFFLRLN